MRILSLLLITTLLVVSACNSGSDNPTDLFELVIQDAKKSYKTSDELNIQLNNKKNKSIEKVDYYIDEILVITAENGAGKSVSLDGQKMGERNLRAVITTGGETMEVSNKVIITASEAPKLYGYEILERYPHDQNAYTQGLEFENDTLYESTGQRRKSTLRKTDYVTGEVMKNVPLEDQYFGEGLTILNDKIYQLTWQAKTGFIYDLTTLEKTGTFVFNKSEEGWGLCNDGQRIFKSDGTEKIWSLNPNTLAEEDFIELYTNTSKIPKVNELEWVEGLIYANIYQRDAAAMVNPENGAVVGVIDLKGLKEEVTQHPELDVLNGIAYKGEANILYVTGKNWDILFKIKVVPK